MKDNIAIRKVESYDYEELAKFNSSFSGDERSIEEWIARFRYWWDENPAYDETWIRGFILLDEDMIVGFVGSFPTFFKVGDTITKAFNGTTWRVLEQYRKWSVDLWFYNRDVSAKYISFNTTPTDDVIKMITRLKYYMYPWGESRMSFFISGYKDFIKAYLPKRFRCCASLIMIALPLYQKLKLKLHKTEFLVKELDHVDSTFDHLWEETCNQYHFTNLRTSESIQWYARKGLVFGVYQGSKLIAYALYHIHNNGTYKFKEMLMVDIWINDNYRFSDIIAALAGHNRIFARNNGIALVKYPHFTNTMSSLLSSMGFLSKKQTYKGFIRHPNGLQLEMSDDNSYFCLLHGDYGV